MSCADTVQIKLDIPEWRPAGRCCTRSETCSRRPSSIRTASSRVLPYTSMSFT